MDETKKPEEDEDALPHSIRTTAKGHDRRAGLVKDFYETTSFDKLPPNFMDLTEARSDDDD